MNIILYINNSSNNVISKHLTEILKQSGNLKTASSIIDPVIYTRITNSDIATNCNYLYIPEFKRYYYVQDIVSIKNDIWEMHCHVDVLQTYESSIKSLNAVVARQENKFNLYLNDEHLKTYQKSQVVSKNFPSGFTDYNYILMVAGG